MSSSSAGKPSGGLTDPTIPSNTSPKLPAFPAFPTFPGTATAAPAVQSADFTGKDGTRYSNGVAISGPGGAPLKNAGGALGKGGYDGSGINPGVGSKGSPGTLANTVQSSPDVLKMQQQYQSQLGTLQNRAKTTDPNQQFLLDKYKERLGNDTTQSLMDRAAGATRDVQAAQRPMLDRAAAMSGAGPGAGAVQQSDAAIRASAKANADIQEQRSRDIDAMVLGGQGIVNAPGNRQLSYDQLATGLTQANPALGIEANKIQQGQLGLQQWSAQNQGAIAQQQLQQNQQNQALQAWLAQMQALSNFY